jgi:hypothetical protein
MKIPVIIIINLRVDQTGLCNSSAAGSWSVLKKGKVVPLHAMKASAGRGGIAPTLSQPHASAALYPRGKDPPVPIVQETGWASDPVWTQRL